MKIQLRYTCSAYHHDAGLIVLPPKSVPCHGRVVYRQSFTQAKNCFLYTFTPEPLLFLTRCCDNGKLCHVSLPAALRGQKREKTSCLLVCP